MKICVITFQFPPEVRGGVGTAINRITRNLAASGIDIHVVAPGPHGPEDSFSSLEENGVTVHRTCPGLGNHFGDPTQLRNIADYVTRLHEREKFDLFHGVFVFPAGHLATLLSKDMGIPSVVSIRGSDIELHRYHWGLFGAVKWTLENASFVTSVAGTLLNKASSFAQICRKKVIKNAFDPNLFSKHDIEELVKTRDGLRGQIFVKKLKNEKEKGKLVVGTTGIIRPGKSGFSILLQAFEDFHRQYPESHLLLIGNFADPEKKKTWLQQFKKRKMIRHISITGRVPHSEVLAWMRQVDVFVLPSLYEGSPNAVLEAMACQRPIISSAVDGVMEIIEDGQDGLLFPSQRSDILCKKLMCLDGDHQISSNAMGDSPYLLYFTASDCRGCDETYPVLKAASTSLPAFVIGVGHPQTLAKKLKNHEIVATVGFDSSRAVLKTCGIIGVPTALLVNEEGIIRKAAMGKPNIASMFASELELQ